MRVVFSNTLSCLLPLQIGFERYQYISLSYIWFAKIKSAIQCATLGSRPMLGVLNHPLGVNFTYPG